MNSTQRFLAILAFSCAPLAGYAMPSWMGVYGGLERYDGGNPGTFTVLMNQDYYGLNAEVGYRIDGGEWNVVPMAYAGHVDGNSAWQLTPDASFPPGASVEFYFHGWDTWGGLIWDSNNGANYQSTASGGGGSEIQLIEIDTGIGGGCYGLCGWLDLDVRVHNLSPDKVVGIAFTTDGLNWSQLTLQHLETYSDGTERWGYHNNFSDRNFGIEFAAFVTANGQTYWDNNNGQDYAAGTVLQVFDNEINFVEDSEWIRTVGSAGHCGYGEAYAQVVAAAADIGTIEEVGVVWTIDDWNTVNVTIGTYARDMGEGFLEYHMNLNRIATITDCPGGPRYVDLIYAIYYTVDGVTYWDNNDGYDFHLPVGLVD